MCGPRAFVHRESGEGAPRAPAQARCQWRADSAAQAGPFLAPAILQGRQGPQPRRRRGWGGGGAPLPTGASAQPPQAPGAASAPRGHGGLHAGCIPEAEPDRRARPAGRAAPPPPGALPALTAERSGSAARRVVFLAATGPARKLGPGQRGDVRLPRQPARAGRGMAGGACPLAPTAGREPACPPLGGGPAWPGHPRRAPPSGPAPAPLATAHPRAAPPRCAAHGPRRGNEPSGHEEDAQRLFP